jgi:hypothetical protein
MGAIAIQRNAVGVRQTSVPCTVNEHHESRLKYYLKQCADMGYKVPPEFKEFRQHRIIGWSDTYRLRDLCFAYRPDEMDEFFLVDHTGIDAGNRIFEITATRELTALGISGSAIAALRARNHSSVKIMLYTRAWVRAYYYEPLAALLGVLQRHENDDADADDDLCLIM